MFTTNQTTGALREIKNRAVAQWKHNRATNGKPTQNFLRMNSSFLPRDAWEYVDQEITGVAKDSGGIYMLLSQLGLQTSPIHPGKREFIYQIRSNVGNPRWDMDLGANLRKSKSVINEAFVNLPWIHDEFDVDINQELGAEAGNWDVVMEEGMDVYENAVLGVCNAIVNGINIAFNVNNKPARVYGLINQPNRLTQTLTNDQRDALNGSRDDTAANVGSNGQVAEVAFRAGFQKLKNKNLATGNLIFGYPKASAAAFSSPYNKEYPGKTVAQQLMSYGENDNSGKVGSIRFVQIDQLPDNNYVLFQASPKVIKMANLFPLQMMEYDSNAFNTNMCVAGKQVPIVRHIHDGTVSDPDSYVAGVVHFSV